MKFLRSLLVSLTLMAISLGGPATLSGFDENNCLGCRNLKLYGEFLWWKVSQEKMQYTALFETGFFGTPGAEVAANDSPEAADLLITTAPLKIRVVEPSFTWRPGFRVGIGYDFPCSNWDVGFAWTSLHQKIDSHAPSPFFGEAPLTVIGFVNDDVGPPDIAKSRWRFQLNTVDLFFGRYCNVCCFKVHPYIGLKAASIVQSQRITYFDFGHIYGYEAFNGAFSHKKNNFYGIGPSVGFDMAWTFCRNFTLTSGINGALLAGRFHLRNNLNNIPPWNGWSVNQREKHRVRPMVDLRIGIDWDACLCNRYPLLLGISYEVQYWWNQWQVFPSAQSSLIDGGEVSSQGDLMMHGITAQAALAF